MIEHPPRSSSTTPSNTFETRNLPLAAFLIAGGHLEYVATHLEEGRGVFTFADPQGRGPRLEAGFHSGALAPATLFHNAVRRLRREIDGALAQQGGAR